MAKKQTISGGIFSRTSKQDQAPQDNSDLDQGNIKPMGVGLTVGEIAALDAIGAEHEVSRNALLRMAARKFIIDYRAGKIELKTTQPPPPKKKLQMPR